MRARALAAEELWQDLGVDLFEQVLLEVCVEDPDLVDDALVQTDLEERPELCKDSGGVDDKDLVQALGVVVLVDLAKGLDDLEPSQLEHVPAKPAQVNDCSDLGDLGAALLGDGLEQPVKRELVEQDVPVHGHVERHIAWEAHGVVHARALNVHGVALLVNPVPAQAANVLVALCIGA